jgi:hypothetical protein
MRRAQARFEAQGDAVYDRTLKLTWARCSFGEVFRERKCSGTIKFLNLDDATKAASARGPGWRLPTVQELSSLLDNDCKKPALSSNIFGDVLAVMDGGSPYWTSSQSWLPKTFYFVDFMDGFVDAHSPGFPLAVRFVKNPR